MSASVAYFRFIISAMSSFRARLGLLTCLGIMLAGAAEQAQGQTYQTWRGEATSGSWQGSTNWWNFPNGSPIVFGQQQWANNHFTEQTNDNGGSTLSTWRWLFQA